MTDAAADPKVEDAPNPADTAEDEGKSEGQIWSELDAADNAAKGEASDPPPDTAAADAKAADDAAAAAASGDDAAKKKAADDVAAAAAAAAASATVELDWSKAAPEFRTAFESKKAELERVQQSDRSQRGRVSTLQRQLNEQAARERDRQARGAPDSGATNGKPNAKPESLLDSPELKAVVEEYPEVAKPILKVVGDLAERQTKREQAEDARSAAAEAESRKAHLDKQSELMTKAHPDYVAVTSTPAFGDWLNDQPRYVQDAVTRNAEAIEDAREAADIVGRFKAFRSDAQAHAHQDPPDGSGKPAADPGKENTGSLSDRRRRQLEASNSTRSRTPGPARGIPEEGDEKAIWNAIEEQERRTGRA